MSQSNERSAEFCRGAVAVLGRMVDECSTVFDSDLPHITQGNLEDYLAEYAKLLAAAEAREAGENAAEISADRAWIDGAKFGWNCETKTDLHEAIANRQLQIREAVVKCPRCDSPDPSLHPAMQLEGEVQPCGDLWHTPATEVIHGDSLSTTVEKLREAIGWAYKLWVNKHMTGAPLPGEEPIPGGNGYGKKSDHIHFSTERPNGLWTWWESPVYAHPSTIAITPAPEAIPGDNLSTTVEKLREACRGVRVEPKPDAPTAAEVIEACEKALHHERQGLQNLIDFRGFWFGGERRYGALTMEELTEAMVRMEAVSALCTRWKEANGDGANTR